MASLSARMVRAADGGDRDLLSWIARYGDEGLCEETLMCLRFPGGWVCPRCVRQPQVQPGVFFQ